MRHGERPNKSPGYGKMFQAEGNRQQATGNRQQATGNRQQATGNYTRSLTNRVNNPIAYIISLFSISFQSVCFYFDKMPSVNFDSGFFINKSKESS